MSAVGLEDMDKDEIKQYCLDVHGVKLRGKMPLPNMIIRAHALDDTLENPLEVGDEVRYQNETGICTVTKVGDTFDIADADGEDYDEIVRTDLSRVRPKLQRTITEKPKPQKAKKLASVLTTTVEVTPDPEAVLEPEPVPQKANYPIEINDSSYRPKPGAMVIGGMPDDGSSNMRKTGVTHVLNDKVEASINN